MTERIREFARAGGSANGFSWMWLGQGGFIYRFGETVIAIDPYLSDAVTSLPRAYAREAEPSDIAGDLLLATHNHDDHFDPETVEYAVRKAGMVVAGPRACGLHYREMGLPQDKFRELNEDGALNFRGVTITAVKAEHEGLADAVGYILTGSDVTIYHAGDSEYNERIAEQTRDLTPDFLFVPINGKWGNMNAHDAALLAQSSGAKAAVPMHFDMFLGNQEDPAVFVKEVQRLGLSCEAMVPERWMEAH